jgi:hypothetical protein
MSCSIREQMQADLVTALKGGDVVAVCIPPGAGLVVTGDPDDIATLAGAVPAVRIRVTRPR